MEDRDSKDREKGSFHLFLNKTSLSIYMYECQLDVTLILNPLVMRNLQCHKKRYERQAR